MPLVDSKVAHGASALRELILILLSDEHVTDITTVQTGTVLIQHSVQPVFEVFWRLK